MTRPHPHAIGVLAGLALIAYLAACHIPMRIARWADRWGGR